MSKENRLEKFDNIAVGSEFVIGALLTCIPGWQALGVAFALAGMVHGVVATRDTINSKK